MSVTAFYTHLRRRGLNTDGEPGRVHGYRRVPAERRLKEHQRRGEALALRERGLTFGQIGAKLGVSGSRAQAIHQEALRERGMGSPRGRAPCAS